MSCCYTRWCWMQRSAIRQPSQTADIHLQELLSRRKNHRKASSTEIVELIRDIQLPRRNGTGSTSSSNVGSSISIGSESSLCLLVDDTVEKWCQMAEDALDQTTARMEVETVNHAIAYADRRLQTDRSRSVSNVLTSFTDYTPEVTPELSREINRDTVPSPNSVSPEPVVQPLSASRNHQFQHYTRNHSLPQLEEDRPLRHVYQPTLYNSFGKESIPPVREKQHPYQPYQSPTHKLDSRLFHTKNDISGVLVCTSNICSTVYIIVDNSESRKSTTLEPQSEPVICSSQQHIYTLVCV